MRVAVPALGLLLVTAFGVAACSSGTTNTTLGFAVAESLLVLDPDNVANGYVILSSGTGNCAALQLGAGLIPTDFVSLGNVSYLSILLGAVDAAGDPIALTAGSYTIVDPNNGSFSPPGLLANVFDVLSDSACAYQSSYASSGTATLLPFDSTDGGISTLVYSAIFGSSQISGTYTLTTCLVPDTTPAVDAGTCVLCSGATADGGPCAFP